MKAPASLRWALGIDRWEPWSTDCCGQTYHDVDAWFDHLVVVHPGRCKDRLGSDRCTLRKDHGGSGHVGNRKVWSESAGVVGGLA